MRPTAKVWLVPFLRIVQVPEEFTIIAKWAHSPSVIIALEHSRVSTLLLRNSTIKRFEVPSRPTIMFSLFSPLPMSSIRSQAPPLAESKRAQKVTLKPFVKSLRPLLAREP